MTMCWHAFVFSGEHLNNVARIILEAAAVTCLLLARVLVLAAALVQPALCQPVVQ